MMCRWISYNMVVFNMIKFKKQLNNIGGGGGGDIIDNLKCFWTNSLITYAIVITMLGTQKTCFIVA